MTLTVTQDDMGRARAALAAVGAAGLGAEAVQQLAEAFADARAADRELVVLLRAALGFYTTSTIVASWIGYDLEDVGDLARQVLTDTSGRVPVAGRTAKLAALTVQLQAALLRLEMAREEAERAHVHAEAAGAGAGEHLVVVLDGKADCAYDEVERLQGEIRGELERLSRRAAA